MPMCKGKCAGEVLLEHLTHFSRIEVHPKSWTQKWRTVYENCVQNHLKLIKGEE